MERVAHHHEGITRQGELIVVEGAVPVHRRSADGQVTARGLGIKSCPEVLHEGGQAVPVRCVHVLEVNAYTLYGVVQHQAHERGDSCGPVTCQYGMDVG